MHQDKRLRLGEIQTPHGIIKTPAFVPVGTQASVKSLTPEELDTLGVQLFFVNTYHTYLRPGVEAIAKFGGLHRFMGWDRPLITDSGGFQVFSLARRSRYSIPGAGRRAFFSTVTPFLDGDVEAYGERLDGCAKKVSPTSAPGSTLVKITDDGVEFRSHWDGSKHFFTPEKSIEIQHQLGADILLAFDECTPYPTTHAYARRAMERTHVWAERSLAAHAKSKKCQQALYGVIQGSIYADLRKESAKFISNLPFDGLAIGGVSVGESKEEMEQVLKWVVPLLPENKPRHLLGVGEIDDIFTLVENGVDTFDCVQPTRLARMGHLYINPTNTTNTTNPTNKKWEIDITKQIFAKDINPIEKDCLCYTCRHFSRAYLHHLFRVRELLAYRLATIHNLYFVISLMGEIREAIKTGRFLELKKQWLYD